MPGLSGAGATSAESRPDFEIECPKLSELRRDTSPGDAKWLQERYPKMKEASGDRLCAAVGDRGFDSAGSRRMLDEQEAFNGLCPHDSRKMQRMRAAA